MKDVSKYALPLAALTSMTLLATLARADYQSAYKKGLDAVRRHAWADAQREMRAAIAEKPGEGEQIKLYGMRFETYLPHYYLGLALFNAGDCAQALKAWGESEDQAVVKSRPEYKELRRDRTSCESRLATARPAPLAAPPRASAVQANPAEQRRVVAVTPSPGPTAIPERPTVPVELADGAAALFRAQYREAVGTLSRARADDPRVSAQALLLRSAARFALYSLSEEKDDALKQAAAADARACRRLDPRITPNPRVFSPPFVAFFSGQP